MLAVCLCVSCALRVPACASQPAALRVRLLEALQEGGEPRPGETVAWMGIGSGLNCMMLGMDA